jgi:hypothetical protein
MSTEAEFWEFDRKTWILGDFSYLLKCCVYGFIVDGVVD